ncbi:MAG TPA: DUF4837 family protein [Candidatus Cloacimonadota bacterium]|nr:DUF4837 family protein [Candidatus Cloacimonadota bacterium]
MRWIILLSVLFMLFGCSGKQESVRYTEYDSLIDNGKPLAMGDLRDVYVFCDGANWSKLQGIVRGSIERELMLVYPEKYFNLIPTSIADYDKYAGYRNLLLIGDLQSVDRVSIHMKQSLAQDFISRVSQSGGDLFIAKNFASRDQLIMYLMADNPENLKTISALQSENLFRLLLKRYRDRLGYECYQQKIIPLSFFDAYPFSIKIPNNYTLYSNDRKGKFISFIYRARMQNREIPDKYVNIYYEDMPDEASLTHAWMIQKRRMIGEKYFEGDVFDENTIRQDGVGFAGFNALRLTGAWTNPKHMIGGAFQSFAFWHQGKAYIVDNSVYFPAGDKLPILQELFVISQSISLK